MANTEEDIKQKVIIPFLKSIEFEESELTFEKSFSMRAGSFTFNIDTAKQIKSISPRLDILVKRDGKNLFIIEAKTDSSDLTDDDKDQAISYARLVHPMAPIAIVTNGKEFKLYKVGDKKEINKEKTKILGYEITEDIQNIYEDALEHFIGYSQENVKRFCSAQIKEGMKTLFGSKKDRNKKFIPELYVRSKKLANAIDNFMNSDKPVFALVGESGAGKTCSMCDLAWDLSGSYPVIFYRAISLINGPTKSIADDFNWEFSSKLDDIALFKRLNKLFKDRKIIIFIDGLDEWTTPQKVEIVGNFASKIKSKNFKLIISCKSGQWDSFLSTYGTPTVLSEELFSLGEQRKGFLIEPFDSEEFSSVINKYRDFYDFRGYFEKEVYEECKKLPFLLRLFFEVAEKNKARHITFSIKEFYEKYYEAVIERVPDKDRAANTILAIAEVLFDKNMDYIDIDLLRKELNFGVNDTIMPALFEVNILEKIPLGMGYQVGFYFDKIRDYIIAFLTKKWDRISLNVFGEEFAKLDLQNVQFDAIRFFYQFADVEKKKIIDEPLRTNAEAYLDFYISVLDDNFCNLKYRFSPEIKGNIGFIGDLDIKNKMVRAFSFRSIEDKDERVKFVPLEYSLWAKDTNVLHLLGAKNIHYMESCNGFNDFNIKKVVLENEVIEHLNEVIVNGLLNETNNYYLSLEKVLGIVFGKQQEIHGIKSTGKLVDFLPITTDRIEYGMRYRKAMNYFSDKLTQERICNGQIKVTRNGSHISYSISHSPEDWKIIMAQAHEAALEMTDFKTYNIDLRKLEQNLEEALSSIKSKKNIIDETLLPDEYDVALGCTRFNNSWLKNKTLVSSYLHKLYTVFLEEYKILVETNFPTLINYFSLYSQMPVHFFIVMIPDDRNVYLRIFNCQNKKRESNDVTICSEDDIVWYDDKFSISYKKDDYEINNISFPDLDSIFRPYNEFINISIPSEFTVIRSLIYKEISDDLPNVTQQLLQNYDIK